jgi:hypothetical protein
MKKRVILGIILIIIAIGGTATINIIGRTYFCDYTNNNRCFRFLSDGTCEEKRQGEAEYSNRGYYYHVVDNGGRDINPYCVTINGTKYWNGMTIFIQIVLGTMFIVGICKLTIAASLRAKNEEKKE